MSRIQILQLNGSIEPMAVMREIGVDPYGIKIMSPKGVLSLIRINALSNIVANILKQEMLSLGGDVAVSRDSLTGKTKKTDCLLMGNLAQMDRLKQKIARQPFGLNALACDLARALESYQKNKFSLELGRHKLIISARPRIMGIINATPDSFSGDGLYGLNLELIGKIGIQMARDGADILDIGGQSSRPGARSISVNEELRRVIPVIKLLSKSVNIPLSIDTVKPEVAKAALDNGATIINDISGLRNKQMPKVAARFKAGVVIMHMLGSPRSMQKDPKYFSLINDISAYLEHGIRKALDAGVKEQSIIVDPGIGFGKTVQHNLEILKRLRSFKVLGKPILVGVSRKSFIGKIINTEPAQRLSGTISSCVLSASNGANILRVHDVKQVRQALKVFDAINNA